MYVAAYDGGASKTRCWIGDEMGNILADCLGGPSNHQNCGPEETRRVITDLLKEALQKADLQILDISYAYLGLAGADLPSDFEMLYKLLNPVFGEVPFKIVNDAWIIMRSATTSPWGAVCICGTGSNAGAAHPDGQQAILRALSYSLGNYGGGGDITREALHYAFRADEKTGPDTLLEKYLPEVLGASDIEDLLGKFYPDQEDGIYLKMKKVPPLVFELASKGDKVCQDILIRMGEILGDMTAGVIKRLDMCSMEIPVVLGGSVFHGNSPLLIDAFTLSIHKTAPKAYMQLPTLPPVAGAYLYGLDSLKLECGSQVYKALHDHFHL